MKRVVLWAVLLTAGCNVSVQQGLEETAANEVLATLERGGLVAKKKLEADSDPPRFSVLVGQSDAPAAIEVLNAHGLPRTMQTGFEQAYGERSLIPTASEERARFLRALSGELEHTLSSVDGVVSARVHLVPQERDDVDPQSPTRVKARAAVLLKLDPQSPGLTDPQVKALIAGAVPGLEPDAVAVVRTRLAARPPVGGTLVAVGPLRVSPASKVPLVVGLTLAMGVIATLAALLLIAARKLALRTR